MLESQMRLSRSLFMNDVVTQKHVFEAVKRVPSLVQRTEAHLENLIVTGALRPKERMPSERDLGESLGVSKTVLREAIRSLAARGLVEVRPGWGTYIRE